MMRWLWLMCWLALGSDILHAAVVFSDDFEAGSGNWSRTSGSGTMAISSTIYSSPSQGLRIGGEASTFDTASIDTTIAAPLDSVEITVWIRRGDDSLAGSENPDTGENLQFQYRNSANNWVTLETFSGGGNSGQIYSRTYTLGPEASHTGFRIGLYLEGGTNGFDYWHIDDVRVEVTPQVLTMNHFAISHGGMGQTCAEQLVTVTAHDVTDGVYLDYSDLVTLTARDNSSGSNVGSWTLVTGSNPGSFINIGNGQARYRFIASDAGRVVFGYTYDMAGSVNFGVSDGAYAEKSSEDPDLLLADTLTSEGNARDEFTASPGSFRDYFSSVSYSRNDGSLTWASDWLEDDRVDGGAGGGDVRVSGGRLELTGNDTSGSGRVRSSAERQLDLSGYSQAVLRFRMRSTTVEDNDNVTVSASGNGGTSWTVLDRIYNDINQFRPFSYDISGHIASNTRIRFRIEDESGSGCCYGPSDEILEIDDVEVLVDGDGLYANNDGSLNWGGSWQESDGDGPLFGEVSVYDDALHLYGDSSALVSVSRAVDLSGYDSALLTFNYQPIGNVDSADALQIQVYSGTTGWNTVDTLTGPASGFSSIDLSGFLAADARIRFVIDDPGSGGGCCYNNSDEYIVIDNVNVEVYLAESCAGCVLGSFAITQPNYALACPVSRSEVHIEAMCEDGIALKEDYTGTVDLQTNENSLSEFYTAVSGGSAVDSITFDGTEGGLKSIYLFHRNENSHLAVTATDTTAAVTSTALAGTDVRSDGFVVSGADHFECGENHSLMVSAVGQTDNGSGSCSVLSGFTGNKTLKVWFEVNVDQSESPGIADAATQAMSINGNAISANAEPSASNLSLNFAAGHANAVLGYADVGEILAVNFRHDEPPYDGSVAELGANPELLGSTASSFIVYPERIAMTVSTPDADCNLPYASCSAFVAAGQDFEVELEAQCSTGARPPAFQGVVNISHQLEAPAAGNSGDLGITNAEFSAGDNGLLTISNQSISEVGVFDMSVVPENYFGHSVSGSSVENIGRFYPDDFNITVVSAGTFNNACSGNFTYIGQAFGYLVNPQLRITALNKGGDDLRNYIDDFDKLGTVSINGPTEDSVALGRDGVTAMQLSASLSAGSFADAPVNAWQKIYTLSNADSFTYTKNANAQVAEFSSDIDLMLNSLTDGDASASVLPTIQPVGSQNRYGRLRLENAYGSELEDLLVPVSTEYWNGSRWRTNTADNCTVISAAAAELSRYTDNLNGGETEVTVGGSASGTVTLVNGESAALVLTSPNLGNEGSVMLTFDADAIDDWLEYDWDNDTTTDNTPQSRVSFGQYRSHDRIIYWREVAN